MSIEAESKKKNMWKTPVRFFLWSAGVLLLITAAAKIASSFGQSPILNLPDPILAFSFRKVLFVVALVELFVSAVCLFSRRIELKVGLIVALASSIGIYRFGLMLIGYHRPCHCLGDLTDMLHIPQTTADTIMKIILAYLLIGSYATLFWLWRQRKMAAPTAVLPT